MMKSILIKIHYKSKSFAICHRAHLAGIDFNEKTSVVCPHTGWGELWNVCSRLVGLNSPAFDY